MTNKAYNRNIDPQGRSFIGDDFETFHCGGLCDFLKAHAAEVFFSPGSTIFVDQLFQRLAQQYPGKIIEPGRYPRQVFISFHGKDRGAARQLADNLKADGISVWLDEGEIKPGDTIDEEISRAVSRCAVFIPIVSKNAQQLHPGDGRSVKYHIREWEWAYSRFSEGQNSPLIIPVIIDETTWRYEAFQKFAYLAIPGGKREGEYEKLKKRLVEFKEKW
jgi:hypothetical protein